MGTTHDQKKNASYLLSTMVKLKYIGKATKFIS